MSATVTVTGKSGPDITVTALVINDVVSVQFDTVKNVLDLTLEDGQHRFFDINAATTITATKAGATYTFTIS